MPVLNPPSTSREIPPSNDEIRLRPTSHIAAILGGRMAESRYQGTEIADTLALMDDLGITDVELSPRQHVSREEILSLAMNRIKRDEIYDSESAQATRAFRALLPDLYGTFIPVRGWLARSSSSTADSISSPVRLVAIARRHPRLPVPAAASAAPIASTAAIGPAWVPGVMTTAERTRRATDSHIAQGVRHDQYRRRPQECPGPARSPPGAEQCRDR